MTPQVCRKLSTLSCGKREDQDLFLFGIKAYKMPQYLYILLASRVIKVKFKKCVVHEVGRIWLHLEKNVEKLSHISTTVVQ